MGTSGPRSPDHGSLRYTCEEARQVVNHQIATLSDIDDKAMWTLRLIVLIFGLLLTATSLAIRADVSNVSRFQNTFTVVGVGALSGSLLFSIVAYTDTKFKAGPSADDINELLIRNYGSIDWRIEMLDAYRQWIEKNNTAIRRDAWLLIGCQLLLLVGIASLMYGIVGYL